MSLEMQRRLQLSEWRVVLVSQTSYPLLYTTIRSPESQEESRWFEAKYAIMKVPVGNRTITKWQEQVRPIDGTDDHWSSDYSEYKENNDQGEKSSDLLPDREQLCRIIIEAGLNPSEYSFSPVPEDNPTVKSTTEHLSAFSNCPTQETNENRNLLEVRSQTLLSPSRPIAYVEQPPPTLERDSSAPEQQQEMSQQSDTPSSTRPLNSNARSAQNAATPATTTTNHASYSAHQRSLSPDFNYSSSKHPCSNVSAEHYLREINSCTNPPIKIVKPNKENPVYRKEIRIRYLQPPTPPPPAPIIIREKRIPPPPPQSPLLIRERKPCPCTPPPLTIRERPPTPPPPLQPCIIDKCLPPPPAQPRQIIVERLPTPPPKPRTVIFEKWLPYKKVKRPVMLEKAPPPEPVKPTRNIIIEYEPLKATTVRRVIEEGVFRADPHQFSSYNAHSQSHCSDGDLRIVDCINDLPPPSENLMRFLQDYTRCSSSTNNYTHGRAESFSEHIPSSIEHLLVGGKSSATSNQLHNISNTATAPTNKQERVLSASYRQSIASPTVIPLHHSGSSYAYRRKHGYRIPSSQSCSQLEDSY